MLIVQGLAYFFFWGLSTIDFTDPVGRRGGG